MTVASFYCYFAGINMGSNLEDGSFHDFSAFFYMSISLAAAMGISNVVVSWLFLSSRKNYVRIALVVLLFCSFFVSLVSASRSALFASILVILFMFYINSKNIKIYLRVLALIFCIGVVAQPYFMPYAERIQKKFEEGKGEEFGSRTILWRPSLNEFKKNPVFGYGFAVSYTAYGKKVGRVESGSGWLSILFQTGITGFCCILMMLKRVLKAYKFIREDKKLFLCFSVFVYLCLHSFFEGYILTTMLYLSLLFWLLLGYLQMYPYYKKMSLKINE